MSGRLIRILLRVIRQLSPPASPAFCTTPILHSRANMQVITDALMNFHLRTTLNGDSFIITNAHQNNFSLFASN